MDLIDKIKAIAKDGVDFSEIEKEIKSLNPLNTVTNKADAWDFIKSNDLLLSVLDSEANKRGESRLENYKTGKMAEEWKAKEEALRAEINPAETEAQKVAREFREFRDSVENKEKLSALQEKLSIKAKELDFDVLKARDYSIYGDKAESKLEEDAKWLKDQVETRVSGLVKDTFNSDAPRKSIKSDNLSTLSDSDLYTVSQTNPSMKTAVLAEISRRSKKI